ncbi:MAG: NAD(P)H-dependent oxidoreductase subunit E [Candidatus Thiodiazotropha sp. (ex Myrtea spinifera)]|nr:NAD(P)H-dependent oxidoreductase subunit E [Candidatus Thiodiazotropha sp. (ex Myrtea spinifera)]MCU7828937.1 NAD(P)H-dependent oxidoreductase subunit E [Candidatus Thiodiazotropha sp. (ex Myrtea sp. 'scaly one' KF741663)]
MSYYRYHLFFCINKREDGRPFCAQHGAKELRDYLKQRVKAAGLSGPGGVRVNTAGCLDRCSEGPVVVVYPEAVWYTFVDKEDMDEIFEKHLVGGEVVDRLRI